MAIDVKFYIFSKKNNSTAQPSSVIGGNTEYITTFSCVIKDSSGIISPVISVQGGSTFNPAYIVGLNKTLNYAYIQAFGNRYYFVDEWTYSDGYWTASLRLDVLASWKSYIGGSTAYVLRSASNYDGSIIDDMYPTKNDITVTSKLATNPWQTSLSAGHYIVGIVGKSYYNTGVGAVQYYSLSQAQMTAFMSYLMDEAHWTDLTADLKFAFNPFQYVASVQWFPLSRAVSDTDENNIYLGWWSLPVANKIMVQSQMTVNVTWDIPKHPQAATRGNYLNLAPYSQYAIDFPPFGYIPLDSTIVANYSKLYGRVKIDRVSGQASLIITPTNDDKDVIYREYAQVGVPIQIAQINQNLTGIAATALAPIGAQIGGAIFGGLSGNVQAGIEASKKLSNIGNTVTSALSQMKTGGANGSIAAYQTQPQLVGTFKTVVDQELAHQGAPLCKEVQINTLSGYVQVLDGELAIPASATELSSIQNYLENGFFYE